MTLQVLLSRLEASGLTREQYAIATKAYRDARQEQRGVLGVAPPTAHPLVVAGVRCVPDGRLDNFVVDYEIIDDVPKPTLEDKKRKLITDLMTAEAAAINAIIAPGKRRVAGLDALRISAIEEDKRSAEDKARLVEILDIEKEIAAVAYGFALRHAEVDDLTEDTIDSWKL